MLIEATPKFEDYIYHSHHYLNCPTQRFNEVLHSMYRQGIYDGKSIANVEMYLTMYKYPKPRLTAEWLVQQYNTIHTQEFNKLNVSSYGDVLPEHIQRIDNEITAYFERHKEWYWNGVYKGTKSYPFRTQ